MTEQDIKELKRFEYNKSTNTILASRSCAEKLKYILRNNIEVQSIIVFENIEKTTQYIIDINDKKTNT